MRRQVGCISPPLNLGGCCRRKQTTPTAPHCAGPPPRTRAASHAANAHAPQPTHCAAAAYRGCDAVTPGLRGCRDRRGAFASPRRSPRVSCRSVVVLLGAPRAAVALSLRVDRAPRARPSAEHTRRGVTDSALDVRAAHPTSRARPRGINNGHWGNRANRRANRANRANSRAGVARIARISGSRIHGEYTGIHGEYTKFTCFAFLFT